MNDYFNSSDDWRSYDSIRNDAPVFYGRLYKEPSEGETDSDTEQSSFDIVLYSPDRGNDSDDIESDNEVVETLDDVLLNYYASGEGDNVTLNDVYASLNNVTHLQTIAIGISLFYLVIVVFRNVASKFKRGV